MPFPSNEDAYWNNLRPNPFDDFSDEELEKLSTGEKIGTIRFNPDTQELDVKFDGSENNE